MSEVTEERWEEEIRKKDRNIMQALTMCVCTRMMDLISPAADLWFIAAKCMENI